ncbi:hypothetical protein L1887_20310 [Cichorium endivia]|nr:hypothetical protein L1887_20310 [Cichorium endivia]
MINDIFVRSFRDQTTFISLIDSRFRLFSNQQYIVQQSIAVVPPSGGGGNLDSSNDGSGGTPNADSSAKKNRGRPTGSGKKQLDALGIYRSSLPFPCCPPADEHHRSPEFCAEVTAR